MRLSDRLTAVCAFLEQRAVIRFFTLKGPPSRVIAAELESMYAAGVLALPTIKKWRKRFPQEKTSPCGDRRSGLPLTNDLAEAIASMLKECPFLSSKVLGQHFRITEASCLRILDANQQGERVTLSHELLGVLESDRQNHFRSIITGDESWFVRDYSHESIWVQSRDEVPERITQKN
jgi:hypothetical protein